MKPDITTGWVIINIGHPRTGNSFIVGYTFSKKRTDAIKLFCQGTLDWNKWKKDWNFRVVRSTQTITINT